MVFCIDNQNEIFLKYALQTSIFSAQHIKSDNVMAEILKQLRLKLKTEFILNILIFADFSRWNADDLTVVIECIEEITSEGHFTNRILLSYNPIQTICLACQHLTSIGNAISVFKHTGMKLSAELLELGAKIVEQITDTVHCQKLFMDKDFQERTVFHLITLHSYPQLFADDKVSLILDKLW